MDCHWSSRVRFDHSSDGQHKTQFQITPIFLFILLWLHSFMNNRMKLWVMFLTAVLPSIVLHFFFADKLFAQSRVDFCEFFFWNSFVGEHWMMLTFLVQPGSLSYTSFLLILQTCKIEIKIICSSQIFYDYNLDFANNFFFIEQTLIKFCNENVLV